MMLFIVDMGGVLAQSFDILPEAARRLAIPLGDMRALASTDMPALLCGTMTADEYWQRFFEDYLVATGAYHSFDGVYASHLMGVAKPDPGFWLGILEAEQTEPGEAFFIDDMEENVRAATGIGIASHHFRGAASLRGALADVLGITGARS